MANSITARFNDDCKVFVSMSDDTTVEKAVIIDADGNETDIGGGGGESDFSTAEVTFINNSQNSSFGVSVPWIFEDQIFCYINAEDMTEDYPFDVVLYKDSLTIVLMVDGLRIQSVSGDITILNASSALITGAGTIIIEDASV